MVCWGTCTNCDKTAETVAKCVAERWIQYFGPPMLIIADQGKEFLGTQFKEFTNANSILLHIIDVRAPWQNGRTERHGDIYKRIFEHARWMHSPSSSVALQRLAMECNAAKNRLSNRSGYSPLQRVFGIGHRLPADLTSDDVYAPDPVYDLAATDARFEESRQIREARCRSVTASRTLFVLDLEPRRFSELMTSSWCGRRTRHRNVAGGLDQACALERIVAVCGSTCADLCGSAASFSANWLPPKSPKVWRSKTNCWMT